MIDSGHQKRIWNDIEDSIGVVWGQSHDAENDAIRCAGILTDDNMYLSNVGAK